MRWAVGGVAVGSALVALVCAPAAWLAKAVTDATGQRLVLADARGTVWRGSAVLVLTGGAGSRSASALPGRLNWTLGLDGAAFSLRARQDCCINGELHLRVAPGLGRTRLELVAAAAAPAGAAVTLPAAGTAGTGGTPDISTALGQWPASWLVGLGTPWNTLQPTGSLQLSSPGLSLEQVQGRWRFNGRADVDLANIASRLSALEVLGSYRLSLSGDATGPSGPLLQLSTRSGALQLNGNGQWAADGAAARLRFNGSATAAPGSEEALGGLLNIIGRRQGALSVISIG
jgi:general secretion pathway protein N